MAIDHTTLSLPETFAHFLLTARFVIPIVRELPAQFRDDSERATTERQEKRDNLESTLKRKIDIARLKGARSILSIVGFLIK